jgi:protein O-mannosyl-transferase
MRRPETKSNPTPLGTSVPAPYRLQLPVWLLAALLVLVTLALYWPAMRFDFINYDDPLYVIENSHVHNGLNWAGVKWAFSNTQLAAYWAPIMWLSHMLACQLFGLNPSGHHLINVLLHAANTVLVFLLLYRLTGATWRSFIVAALFGWHPLRVESVAWITERKDVLSTCFGLLSLLFYVRYVKKSNASSPQSKVFYSLSLLCFAFGLMSKPMLVTWPFVMLLLDWWPLGRVTGDGWRVARVRHLVFEKLPFFVLAAVMSIVTFVAQKRDASVITIKELPLDARAGNALISYCRYLEKLLWPADLAVFYPYPGKWPITEVILAGGFLLSVTVFCAMTRRRYPFLLMGWLWYCGTLVPVIGLVQAGWVAMADRFTYVPSLGMLILTIWGTYGLTRHWRYQTVVSSVAACMAIVTFFALTRLQLAYWKDSGTLFRHALEVTENNYIAHNSLGLVLDKQGQHDEAISQYLEVIRLKPDYVEAHNNLGIALDEKGQPDAAIHQFQEAIRLKPNHANAQYNLGIAFLEEGRVEEAINQFQEVIRLQPDFTEAYSNLGNAFGRKGRIDEAIKQFLEAIRLQPDYADAHNSLGTALLNKGQTDEAVNQYRQAIRLQPDFAEAYHNLGTVLLKTGHTDEAISQFREAIQLRPDYAEAHNNLGTALGKKGQIDEAIFQYQEAIRLKPDMAEARNNLTRLLEIKNGSTGR